MRNKIISYFLKCLGLLLMLTIRFNALGIELESDSIQKLLAKNLPDTTRAKNLCLYCEITSNQQPKKALFYGKKGLALAINTKNLKLIANCYREVGVGYASAGQNEKAISSINTAIDIAETINDELIIIKSYIHLSVISYNLEDFTKSLDYSNKILEFSLKNKNKLYESYAYLSMAGVYNVSEDYKKALLFLNKAKSIREELNDTELLYDTYVNLGSIYLNINQVDSAMLYYSKSIDAAAKMDDEYCLASAYKYFGICYLQKNDLIKANTYLNKSQKIFEKYPNKIGQSLLYINLGLIRLKQKRYNEAISFFEKSLTFNDPLQYSINAYLYLSASYDSLKSYNKAMDYLISYYNLKDSLINGAEKLDQNRLDIKYQKERREKELLIKQKEIIEQKANLNYIKNRQYIIIGILLVLSLVFFVLLLYHKQLKERQLVILEKEIEAKQKIILIEEKKVIETQYESLKNQVNPHFLFNSLNSLIELIDENPKDAIVFAENLSIVYRYILQCQNNKIVTLAQELDIARSFLFLIKKRFEDKIIIDIQIPDACLKKNIIPLSLQILLENCLKHNIISTNLKLYIFIYIENENYIVVKNNYQPKTSSEVSTHIGLNNLKSRYIMLSHKDIIIEKDNFFTVKIPLLS